jgi:hypothetical protein
MEEPGEGAYGDTEDVGENVWGGHGRRDEGEGEKVGMEGIDT